jgi:hypothetical protein
MLAIKKITLEQRIDALLIKHQYQPLDEIQLAKLTGFTDKQIILLKLFWGSAFNDSEIYLSDELILNHLTDEKGKDAIKHFIDRKLKDEFVENEDYCEADKNHELVVKYYENLSKTNDFNEKKASPNLAKPLKNVNLMTKRKYYIALGQTFKKLLMRASSKKGIETRDYYLKVEELCKTMHLYINKMNLFNSQKLLEYKEKEIETKEKQIEEAQKQAEIERKAKEKLQEQNKKYKAWKLKSDKKVPKGWLYVTATDHMQENNECKPGIIRDISPEKLKSRLATYNTGNVGNDAFYYIFIAPCFEPQLLETRLKELFSAFRVDEKKETLHIKISDLIDYVREYIDFDSQFAEKINALMERAEEENYYENPHKHEKINLNTFLNQPEEPEEKQPETINLRNLSADELKNLSKRVLVEYINKTSPNPISFENINTLNQTFSITWNSLKTDIEQLPAKGPITQIKNKMKELISGLNGKIKMKWKG